ncbi:MAG: AI-2E family transporter [Candidatus Dormibacteraeota bacterium]|uniref:AI-2E family transporter n=1 Tax=Candidatus Amunia macphersoniae TaxID=3127014 RepID=A0A934N8I1_9BACT|nr:AI-2E family transporter [Candidatus Dormibacteraeota bacterium]
MATVPQKTPGRKPPGDAGDHRSWWHQLGRPLEALVWLLIVLAVIGIYRGAEFLVVHIFNVLLLFIFAAVIALILTPLVDRIQKLPPFRRHRSFAVLALYLVAFAAVALVVVLVVPSVIDQGKQLPALATRLQSELDRRGVSFKLSSLASGASGGGLDTALGILAGVVSGIVNVVLIMVISIYLLIEGRGLVATARNLFPSKPRLFDFTALAVGSTLAAYVRGQLILSAVIGTYTGIALTLLGVHYGVVIGVAAFFLEFIPIVGAVVAMVVGVGVALLQSPLLALLAAVVGLLGHALDAYIVGPRVNARVTQLHPLMAMAALLVGAELAGILGALFAVPLAAIANILLGALYRSRRGQVAMSTDGGGEITADNLPRLGEEIGGVEEEGIDGEPVPHKAQPAHAGASKRPAD